MSHLIILVTPSHEKADEARSKQLLLRTECARCEGNHFFLLEIDHRCPFTYIPDLAFLMYKLQLQIHHIKFFHATLLS